MTSEEACRLVQAAVDLCSTAHDLESRTPLRLLKAADALGYSDPGLAVKEACVSLFAELRSTQSRLSALSMGTFLGSTSGTEPLR